MRKGRGIVREVLFSKDGTRASFPVTLHAVAAQHNIRQRLDATGRTTSGRKKT